MSYLMESIPVYMYAAIFILSAILWHSWKGPTFVITEKSIGHFNRTIERIYLVSFKIRPNGIMVDVGFLHTWVW